MTYNVAYRPVNVINPGLSVLAEVDTVSDALLAVAEFAETEGQELLPCNIQAVAAVKQYAPQSGWYLGDKGIVFIKEAPVTPSLPVIPVGV